MNLSRQALNDYDSRLQKLEVGAYDYVKARVESFLRQFPEASTEQVRDFVIGTVNDAVIAFGDGASSVAADFYDAMAEASGTGVKSAMIDTSDVSEYVEKGVRYQMTKFLGGDLTGFVSMVSKAARDQVSRRANQTMRVNAKRDGRRYARVPMGGETCTFCAMLASRGFVYRSAKIAGEGNHFHPNCRCKVIPGFDGMSVQGYDPNEWLFKWKGMQEIDKIPYMDSAEKASLKSNVSNAREGSRKISFAVGAKALTDYVVNMPGGKETRFFPGSEIEEKVIFAGKGSDTVLRAIGRLSDTYGGSPEDWYHASGEGWIFDHIDGGRIKKAEVHWMGNDDVGLVEFYFKRWVGRYRES